MARPEIRPAAGFCIQTDSLGTPAGRWYLNMTRHKLVEMPVAHSGKVVSREFILGHGIGSMKIPFDMGSFRKLKERADGARQTAYAVDVVFNPFIIQMFMDDEFNATMTEYRPFIINLALQRIESSIGVKLSTQKVKLVKKFFYKDGEGRNSDEPKELTELPQEIDEALEEVQPSSRTPAPPAEPDGPLIQDVTPGNKKKPVVKKGFLNKTTTALYPEGSNEGVLPENAGDPMGYLPKGLRKNCKIVDTGAPEYQESEKKRQAAAEQNNMTKEMSEMLQANLGAYNKPGNQWDQEDRPDGSDIPATDKYKVDYSRFDKIADVSDEKPAVEERDWYCDEGGVVRYKSATKASSGQPETAASKLESSLKKGFLDDAKSALYPKGSEQRAPPDEAKMMENFGKDPEFMRQLLGGDSLPEPQALPQAQKPTMTVKASELKTPDFTLDCDDNDGLLQLVVGVPGLESMQGVDLDVTETCASIVFPHHVGLKPLKVELPSKVVPTSVKAKFSKKNHQLTVKLPLLLKVAKAG